ncbi:MULTISPECIES: pentapeptide repeat-containing protein [Actinomadura]|uniref:Pentapeptide repeat-containing protein n=1 Tax=Actinomadura yumaensis TaxID=111807 RepID=A0ABW2CTW7_9ACTN|nr:pentapeptide repeat-containing protein [Actinomadura sp. J1-007]MWK37398.1 hypothetical protein [Actinomadura sp. J1-007]
MVSTSMPYGPSGAFSDPAGGQRRAARRYHATRTTGTAPAVPPAPDPREEHQVRLTAQRLLSTHLRPDAEHHWADISLDLTGATLTDFVLTGCHLHNADFTNTVFTGFAGFQEAAFSGDTRFSRTTFSGDAQFRGVTFGDFTWFTGAVSSGHAGFGDGPFSGVAAFAYAAFSYDAGFGGAAFSGDARFGGGTTSSRGTHRQRSNRYTVRVPGVCPWLRTPTTAAVEPGAWPRW